MTFYQRENEKFLEGEPPEIKITGTVENTERIWKHLSAGSAAAIISRTATAPLDRLKTIAQASGQTIFPISGVKMMLKEGGFLSMWRGNGANLIKAIPEVSSKFVCFNEFKYLMMKGEKRELKVGERLVAGGLSGMISHSFVHPIEVCKTRLILRKTGESRKLMETAIEGFRSDGIKFFYRGYFTSMIGILLFSASDLTSYEMLKKHLKEAHEKNSKLQIIFCGVCSSFAAQCIAYPFAVIGVFMQTVVTPTSVRGVLEFVKGRGIAGMYKGISLALLKGIPTYTIAYFIYETVLSSFQEEMI